MAYHFIATRLLTHKHVPEYSHEDEQEYLGFRVKVIEGRASLGDGFDASVRQRVHLTASRPVSRKEMSQALHEFDRGCACEHDCCGHLCGGAYDLRRASRNGRRWTAILSYSPNV